jgi:hypothetical protein
MKPTEVFRLRPGQRIRWTATIWDQPVDGEITAITPECNFVIAWDDNSISTLTPSRLAFGTFEVLNEDQGITTLQDDIAARLRRADIPEGHITDILELIADGEETREEFARIEAQQNHADARAIDQALEAHHRWTNT